MTAVELYRAEKARHIAKQEELFAPIRAQLAAMVDAHPQSLAARNAKRKTHDTVKERNAAYYQRTKATQKLQRAARRDLRANNASYYERNRQRIREAQQTRRANLKALSSRTDHG